MEAEGLEQLRGSEAKGKLSCVIKLGNVGSFVTAMMITRLTLLSAALGKPLEECKVDSSKETTPPA